MSERKCPERLAGRLFFLASSRFPVKRYLPQRSQKIRISKFEFRNFALRPLRLGGANSAPWFTQEPEEPDEISALISPSRNFSLDGIKE
jgi:hypothetical protein